MRTARIWRYVKSIIDLLTYLIDLRSNPCLLIVYQQAGFRDPDAENRTFDFSTPETKKGDLCSEVCSFY